MNGNHKFFTFWSKISFIILKSNLIFAWLKERPVITIKLFDNGMVCLIYSTVYQYFNRLNKGDKICQLYKIINYKYNALYYNKREAVIWLRYLMMISDHSVILQVLLVMNSMCWAELSTLYWLGVDNSSDPGNR